MATKTTKSSQPEPGSINIKFAQRLAYGLRQVPENMARKLGTCVELAAIAGKSLNHLVDVAAELSVDPRWLAIGRPSGAGHAAEMHMRRHKGQYELPEAKVEALFVFLRSTPEPDRYPGTCRYCGCTDEHGCGDCEWVDPSHTICSTCLEPEA